MNICKFYALPRLKCIHYDVNFNVWVNHYAPETILITLNFILSTSNLYLLIFNTKLRLIILQINNNFAAFLMNSHK